MMKKWLIGFIVCLVAGCGFHLRGMVDMPEWLNNVAIVNQSAHRDLVMILKDQLQAYHIHVVDNPARADYLLVLEKDALDQQLTNVAASTVPRQYQLSYQLYYSLIRVNGRQPIASSRTVTTTRQLTINNNRILGSDFEGGVIISEMHRDAAQQLIGRLSKK